MSAEYLPHLFDAFSQEDSSSTNKYGSTGLGMPITKSIVELMNGSIDVESKKAWYCIHGHRDTGRVRQAWH